MVKRIERDEVQRLLKEEGAQLVEVLPAEEYTYEHIAGALHIWLRDLEQEAPQRLDRGRPVVVYCNDFL
jgi:rhodanese-related sulfurtransferase